MISLAEFLQQPHKHTGWGDMEYRIFAPRLLPKLLWCAVNRKLMAYSDLAENIGFPEKYRQGSALVRSAGWLTGFIGNYCDANGLPPLNALIVNTQTRLPSIGAAKYFNKYGIRNYDRMETEEKREALQNKLYPLIFQPAIWSTLLEMNGIKPEKPGHFRDYDQDMDIPVEDNPVENIRNTEAMHNGGIGESEAHNALKEYIIEHCGEIENLRLLGCKKERGETEHLLPSLDRPDVFFQNEKFSVACEVKSWRSDEADILRGIFQCVKYKAVLNATDSLEGRQGVSECILIVQNALSQELQRVANRLRVPHIVLSKKRVGNGDC